MLLDVDGTLAEIRTQPGDVVVPKETITAIAKLVEQCDGAVAIVSGRRISDIDQMLAPLRIVTAGVHGIQMRRTISGAIDTIAPPFPLPLLKRIAVLTADYPGLVVEPKGSAVAVHYRQAPQYRSQLEQRLKALVQSYDQHLELSYGRMVYEIIPRTYSKGAAVKIVMTLPPFIGRVPVMIGDDAPDVPAFATAVQLGGRGLTVGGEYFDPSGADFEAPKDVRAWLKQAAEVRTVVDG